MGAHSPGAVRDEARGGAVHAVCELDLLLAEVDRGERRAVEDQVRREARDDAEHVVAVGEVVVGQVQSQDLVVLDPRQQINDLGAELSVGAGDDDVFFGILRVREARNAQ